MRASLTFYNGRDDPYGTTTARGNPNGKTIAIQGSTIAVDPHVIPYGSLVLIPALKNFSLHRDGKFFAHDTGSAVVAKTASKKRGNDFPVIDVFADVPENFIVRLAQLYGETVEYDIIPIAQSV